MQNQLSGIKCQLPSVTIFFSIVVKALHSSFLFSNLSRQNHILKNKICNENMQHAEKLLPVGQAKIISS